MLHASEVLASCLSWFSTCWPFSLEFPPSSSRIYRLFHCLQIQSKNSPILLCKPLWPTTILSTRFWFALTWHSLLEILLCYVMKLLYYTTDRFSSRCVSLHLRLSRQERNFKGYNCCPVFGFQLYNGTGKKTVRPNRKWMTIWNW